MQSVQRRFGKLLPRTADESQVAVLLKDFDDADKMLARLIDAAKAWRDSWTDILTTQQRLVQGFQTIYEPIIGANESYTGHEPLITPASTLERTAKLQSAYEELKADLLQEVNMVDARIVKPAMEAKDWIQPLKKVIKKRGDRKLDFEKYQLRVDTSRKKAKRSDRDNAYLAKAETELVRAKEEYSIADDQLKTKLPPVVSAAFSLLPHLLASQILIQNSLLGNYYTLLHDFCTDEGFPSPPPPMTEIISAWNSDFQPAKREVESLACVAGGKTVRRPMDLENHANGSSVAIANSRNSSYQRRASSQSNQSIQPGPSTSFGPPSSPAISATSDPPSPNPYTRPRISSIPSQTSLSLATPNYGSAIASPSPSESLTTHAPAGPRADYFTRDRLSSSSTMASIAAKKKPPPPIPPKRMPSSQGFWVTALYEFAGQGHGDLAFREGDRIKVVKKTDSIDDWWQGLLIIVNSQVMADKVDSLLKKPLYVFDLPHELLVTLQLKHSPARQISQAEGYRQSATPEPEKTDDGVETTKPFTSCILCGATFPDVQEQRRHVRSDWHGYNLKQKLKGLSTVNEGKFEKLVEDLDESISGSETSESEDNDEQKESTLSTLLKRQAKLHHGNPGLEDNAVKKPKRGSGKPPLLWFSTPLLPSNISLGIYRALFTETEQENEAHITEILREKQLSPTVARPPLDGTNGVPLPTSMASPQIFLCMIGGGHFAAMIVSLAPKINKNHTGIDGREATVLAHKTFHRYTTRRKQGGAQSANDSAKGAAHSAGASIRRYNEMALESEIRALLTEWKELIDKSQLVFVRATGSSNRRIIFGPYDGQVLRHNDPRNRSFPFNTRRATQAELMRSFKELTRMKVSEIDEEALAAAAAAETERAATKTKTASTPIKPVLPKVTKEEEAALLHTTQLQALIRRSKAPATLSYLSTNNISADFEFQPEDNQANHHAPTPLHLASSINSSIVVLALLTKAAASPLKINGEGKPAFDLAGDRATRDAFRVARSELGEERWDWEAAHCPPALSKAEADKRDKRAKAEEEKAEAERRQAEIEQLKQEAAAEAENSRLKKVSGKPLGAAEKTGAEKREEEARGMTPELRMRLERERRARAAEERMKRSANRTGGAGAGR